MWSMSIQSEMSNNNNYIIIGGTSGIGLATADYLRDLGENVLVGSRHINEESPHDYFQVDVTSIKSINLFFIYIKQKLKTVNGLVYSVGITTQKKSIEEFDEDVWKRLIDVNVTGLLRVLKVFYPLLIDCCSKVVIVNSIASKKYSEYSGFEYTASKCALSGIVRQLAIEWRQKGIMINSIFPSMTNTPMLSSQLDEKQIENILGELPLNKLAETLDSARAIEFLLNPENNYMTGTGINVTGGVHLDG
jgi:NAD(P)-dependent dehydrogenase (short-subunit alcohol dehydrogenase family)